LCHEKRPKTSKRIGVALVHTADSVAKIPKLKLKIKSMPKTGTALPPWHIRMKNLAREMLFRISCFLKLRLAVEY